MKVGKVSLPDWCPPSSRPSKYFMTHHMNRTVSVWHAPPEKLVLVELACPSVMCCFMIDCHYCGSRAVLVLYHATDGNSMTLLLVNG